MIGILCAMEEEIKEYLDRIVDAQTRVVGGFKFVQGVLMGKRVILCQCGVGKVNAAACTQALILTWPVKLVINSGVAGALREPLEVGDICVATDLVQYDVDTSALGDPVGFVSTVEQTNFRCAEWAVAALLQAARSIEGVRTMSCRVATGDQFMVAQANKDRVVRLFDACATEMEGAAVAQVCFLNGVDCAVVRAISDASTGKNETEYRQFMPDAARTSAKVVLKFLEG